MFPRAENIHFVPFEAHSEQRVAVRVPHTTQSPSESSGGLADMPRWLEVDGAKLSGLSEKSEVKKAKEVEFRKAFRFSSRYHLTPQVASTRASVESMQ